MSQTERDAFGHCLHRLGGGMSARTRPCRNGPRHAWSFVKNITRGQISSRGASFALVGLYRCACGERKHGQFNPNEQGDLRDAIAPASLAQHREEMSRE